jgi:predicted RNase H-like HicB family nuclease
MAIRHYLAVAEQAAGEEMWSILFPDFPGVTSAACDLADLPRQARDALATAVEDMIAEGEPLPPSAEEGGRTEVDIARFPNARPIVVAVKVPDASTGETAASTAAS